MRRPPIDPAHGGKRNALRVFGLLFMLVGGVFLLIGIGSFFSAFGGGGMPRSFWCAFVGMPVFGIGVGMLKAGFMGAVARYQAGEYAPVAKDTFNYMAEGTKDGVRELASAVGEGLRGEGGDELICPGCGAGNEAGSKFCDQCGRAFPQAIACSDCGAENQAGSRFCDQCGAALDVV